MWAANAVHDTQHIGAPELHSHGSLEHDPVSHCYFGKVRQAHMTAGQKRAFVVFVTSGGRP